jgi:S1-C subfamily serine protease
MDKFGVQKPALKAIARTPEFPNSSHKSFEPRPGRDARIVEWLGARIKNVTTLGEISAAGLPREMGVRIVDAPAGTMLARAGLHDGDVILECKGKALNSVEELRALAGTGPNEGLILGVYRDSRIIPIVLH